MTTNPRSSQAPLTPQALPETDKPAPAPPGGAGTNFKRARIKSNAHEEFIRALPCLICGDNTTTEAAHISYADMRYGKFGRGKGQKEESIWVVPLCGQHHRTQHDMGEKPFWRSEAIDPCRVAAALFIRSQDYQTALEILEHARDQ